VELNFADIFEYAADAVPDREAVVSGGRRLTFAALEERANRLASHLAAAEIGPGDHVACYLYNGTEYLETMLAAYKLRASAVNVNWRYVAGELLHVLRDSDAKAIVYDSRFTATLEEVTGDLPLLRTRLAVGKPGASGLGAASYEDALAGSSPERRFAPRRGDDIYLLYTGGTTGMPKGVMWRHEDLLAGSLGNLDGASSPEEVAERARRGGDRSLPACPLMHGAAQWVSLATLFAGGTVVLLPGPRLDARRLARLMADERVTVITIVGDAVGRPLADALEALAAEDTPLDLSNCRVVLTSGAFLSPPVKDALLARLPHAIVYDTFGSSESGTFARSVSGAGETPPQGRFVSSEQATVLDDDLRPIPPGSGRVGRLARSGRVALGYYNDPEKTAATFPVVDGVRYVVTGDHATIEADGSIRLLGRGSACINTGGEKVYPDEVEAALKSHPGVADAMVVGLPDERFGERVVALVVPRGVPAEIPDDLDAHVRRLVAGYKVPRATVAVGAIERFPSGKPDYAWGRAAAEGRLGSLRS
jgi:acyl-CoA synthetase (AMP-forming)/AMP-acid ligase II